MRGLLVHPSTSNSEIFTNQAGGFAWALASVLCAGALVAVCALCAGSKAERTQQADVPVSVSKPPHSTQPPQSPQPPQSGSAIQFDKQGSCVSTEGSVLPEIPHAFPGGSSLLASSTAATTAGVQKGRCDIELEGDSVDDVMRLLNKICDEMNGAIGPQHHIHKESIRSGINTAVAEVTSHGVTSTAMFFPRHNRYSRQRKMYKKQWVSDFMPNVNSCNDGMEFRHNNCSVMLPPHILVDRCTSVPDAIARCDDDKALSAEVFLICIQLYYQISAFHIRKKVVRDLCMSNVVQTLTGTQRRWTLLEYCSSAAAGTDSSYVPLRMTVPELADARMRGESLRMDRPFDVWQLGILVYEIVQRRPYWRPDISEAELLHTLASADVPLPHEVAPVRLDNVQGMLRLMLARDPTDRPKHDGLKTVLEDHDKSGTVGVWTNYPSRPDGKDRTVELPV